MRFLFVTSIGQNKFPPPDLVGLYLYYEDEDDKLTFPIEEGNVVVASKVEKYTYEVCLHHRILLTPQSKLVILKDEDDKRLAPILEGMKKSAD